MANASVSWTDFTIVTETFKEVDDHEIKVDVALPPDLSPGKHPLIVAYHGGYLISGARNHYAFIAAWLPAYAAANGAIVVLPDHRLLPSATAADIRSDLEDLWTWVQHALPSVVTKHFPEHSVDMDRILLEGNSAGGFCVAHLALDHGDEVRAAIMVYPMVDCLSDYLQRGTSGAHLAPFKGADLQARIKAARAQGWISERYAKEDAQFTSSVMKSGEFGAMFGQNKDDNPIDKLRNKPQALPSRIWILHGKEDFGVPVQGSLDFFNELQKLSGFQQAQLDVIDDEPSGHGFDSTWSINDEKLAKRLRWIDEAWLDGNKKSML